MHEPHARRSSTKQISTAPAHLLEHTQPWASAALNCAPRPDSRKSTDGPDALLSQPGNARSPSLRATDSSSHRERLVQQLPEGSVGDVLTRALQLGLPIKVSVLVEGRFQHWCSPLNRVGLSGPWLLAEGPGGTLKLREDGIAGIWLLRQPCLGGLRCWLELIDAHGALLATLGSGGATGLREPCEWRLLLESLCDGQTSSHPPDLRLAD